MALEYSRAEYLLTLTFVLLFLVPSVVLVSESLCDQIWWTGGISGNDEKFFMNFTSGNLEFHQDNFPAPIFYQCSGGGAGYMVDGQLWMYTDGKILMDNRSDPPVAVAQNWTDPASPNPVAVFPLYGNCSRTLFGVIINSKRFTHQQGDLHYAKVDFTNQPAQIDQSPEVIYEDCNEVIGLVENTSGSGGVWILTCSEGASALGRFEVMAIEIDSSGNVGRTVPHLTPYPPSSSSYGSIHFNAEVNRMAIGAHGKVAIAHFDQSTGVISDWELIHSAEYPVSMIFSVFVSDSGEFVYIDVPTIAIPYSRVLQHNISSNTTVIVTSSDPYISGGMKRGPDGKLYITKLGISSLGVINDPDIACPGCGFSVIPITGGWKSGSSLPMNTICLEDVEWPCSSPPSPSPSPSLSSPCNQIWWTGYQNDKFFMDFTSGDPEFSLDDPSLPSFTSLRGTAGYMVDGQLWMFTDGIYLFDNRLDPPVNITQNWLNSFLTATNPVAVFPLYGNCSGTLFGVILNSKRTILTEVGYLYYAKVDFTNQPAQIDQSPEVIYEDCNGVTGLVESTSGSGGVWILTCSMGRSSGEFDVIAIEIDSSGNVGRYVPTVISYSPVTYATTVGAIHFNEAADRMVIAAHGQVFTMDFDRSTGVISDWELIYSPDDVIYGAAISNNGQYVYFTKWSSSRGTINQYDTITDMVTYTSDVDGSRGMKFGPNGKLYITTWAESSIRVINSPDMSCPDECGISEITLPSGAKSGLDFQMNTLCVDEFPPEPCPPSESSTPSRSIIPSDSESPRSFSESVSLSPISPSDELLQSKSSSVPSEPDLNSEYPSPSFSIRPTTPWISGTILGPELQPSPVFIPSPRIIGGQSPMTIPTPSPTLSPIVHLIGSTQPLPNDFSVSIDSKVPLPVIVSFPDSPDSRTVLISPVVELTLVDPSQTFTSSEICFNVYQRATRQSCLGYWDTSKNKWVCEDYCLKTNNRNQVCGTTTHYTMFAILLQGGSGGSSRECESDIDETYITGSFEGDLILVCAILGAAALFVLFVVIFSRFESISTIISGEEGMRVKSLRQSAR